MRRCKVGVVMRVEKIRAVLCLWSLGKSQNEISEQAGVSRAAVQDYTRRAKAVGLSAEVAQGLSDEELLLKLGKVGGHRRRAAVEIDYAWVTSELGKKGVTRELLFRELVAQERMPAAYATFCRRIQDYERATGVVLRQSYTAGEYLLVDYTGLTVPIWNDARTAVSRKAQIFVGALGYSGLIFCEATKSQEIEHFIGSHVRSFEFYSGVPLLIVSDNLKSEVTKVNWYEPELTRAYAELGEHYGTTILPARAKKPRDKGKVERAVLDVERWVLAPLRNIKFTSVVGLNAAMRPLIKALNERQMREHGASRLELFERVEKGVLKPLPQKRYEVTTTKLAKVNIDYHIEFEKHYYSVPYQLVHQEVWIRAGEFQISIILGNKCVATHLRNSTPHRYTTLIEHMPANHRAVRSRTAEGFVAWAATIGTETQELVERVFLLVRHEQQAFRSILGIQRLAKTYSSLALELAAKEANTIKLASCKSLRGIIARQHADRLKHKEHPPVIAHANLRDPVTFQ